MDITFNTKRLYTTEGQVVRAVTQPDGSILFHDFSRMVTGRIAAPLITPYLSYDFVRTVMQAYDNGRYTNEWMGAEGMPKRDDTLPIEVHRV